MIVLHKVGDTKDCSNFITFALISHTSKIMIYIILDRMKAKVEELAGKQSGFRPWRGTGLILCAIQVMLEKVIESNNQ